ncbi:alpha/beta fold hydrolase [Blastococcus sp. SYSU D01042]
MATFVLIHGSGDGGWAWHLVQRALQERGHHAVAPDLPTDDDDATWDDCAAVVRAAAAGAPGPVLVGHSSGGQVVPLAAEACGASLQVFVAGLVPRAGETPEQWFAAVGWGGAVARARRVDGGLTGHPDPLVAYYHDVPAGLAAEALARERPTGDLLGRTPWPLPDLPAVPSRFVVTALDRFIPPAVQRRVAADRLGIPEPDVIQAGHCVGLSRPDELARLLAGYADAVLT